MKKTIIMRKSLEASWFFISTLTKSGYKLFTGSLLAEVTREVRKRVFSRKKILRKQRGKKWEGK